MNPSITFPLNELFKNNPDQDTFWTVLLQGFVQQSLRADWPLPYRPVHLIGELQSFFKTNGVFDTLTADKKNIRLVLQERPAYSMVTFKLTDEVNAMVPKSYWFLQIEPKPGEWKSRLPMDTGEWNSVSPNGFPRQDTRLFAGSDPQGSLCLWGDTPQPDGVVHVVERVHLPEDGSDPVPITFS